MSIKFQVVTMRNGLLYGCRFYNEQATQRLLRRLIKIGYPIIRVGKVN